MRIRLLLSLLACSAFLLQMFVFADWVDDVIEVGVSRIFSSKQFRFEKIDEIKKTKIWNFCSK
jgi:hypothetical protein